MRPAMIGSALALALACGGAQAGAAEARQQADAMAAMHHDDAPVPSPAAQTPPGPRSKAAR
ncbi:MAG TPA: hypothetical protein VFA75_02785 [Nevskia sp.]|nr:hypothetical protein [Nevskia sp.]